MLGGGQFPGTQLMNALNKWAANKGMGKAHRDQILKGIRYYPIF